MTQLLDYDIAIVGSGIVGLTLASLLSKQSLRIAIIDPYKIKQQWDPQQYDLRVSAITQASQRIFAQTGAWQAMLNKRVSPYEHMNVWNSRGEGKVQFHASDVAEANLGHIIENSVIQQALFTQLKACDHVSWITAKIVSFQTSDKCATIQCDNAQTLNTKLLVGADGGRSQVRQLANIDTTHWPYQQSAIVATVTTEKPHKKTAWQVFLPTGPLAFLPLADPHTCSIVWSQDDDTVNSIFQLEDEAFKHKLSEHFADKLGNITDISERKQFPLHMQHAKTYVKSRLALIGDAAHTIHPLAGQGANLGIADAQALAINIINAYQQQRDMGDYYMLRKYERARKGQNIMMLVAMEGFKRGFGSDSTVLQQLCNLGLNVANTCLPIKNTFVFLGSESI